MSDDEERRNEELAKLQEENDRVQAERRKKRQEEAFLKHLKHRQGKENKDARGKKRMNASSSAPQTPQTGQASRPPERPQPLNFGSQPNTSPITKFRRLVQSEERIDATEKDANEVANFILGLLPDTEEYRSMRDKILDGLVTGLKTSWKDSLGEVYQMVYDLQQRKNKRKEASGVTDDSDAPSKISKEQREAKRRRKLDKERIPKDVQDLMFNESVEQFLERMSNSIVKEWSGDAKIDNEYFQQEEDIGDLSHESSHMEQIIKKDWGIYSTLSAFRLVAAFRLGRDFEHLHKKIKAAIGGTKGSVPELLKWLIRRGFTIRERTVRQKRQLWNNLGAYPLFQFVNVSENELAKRSGDIKSHFETIRKGEKPPPSKECLKEEFWQQKHVDYLVKHGYIEPDESETEQEPGAEGTQG